MVVFDKKKIVAIFLSVALIGFFCIHNFRLRSAKAPAPAVPSPARTAKLFKRLDGVLKCRDRYDMRLQEVFAAVKDDLDHGANPYDTSFKTSAAEIAGEQYIKVLNGKTMPIHDMVKTAREGFEGWSDNLNSRYGESTVKEIENKVLNNQKVDVEAFAQQGLAWYERALVSKKTMINFCRAIPAIRGFAKLFKDIDEEMERRKPSA